jgi:hypothetical protein
VQPDLCHLFRVHESDREDLRVAAEHDGLGEAGSGITAVNEILRSTDIPVIFVTANPEPF